MLRTSFFPNVHIKVNVAHVACTLCKHAHWSDIPSLVFGKGVGNEKREFSASRPGPSLYVLCIECGN